MNAIARLSPATWTTTIKPKVQFYKQIHMKIYLRCCSDARFAWYCLCEQYKQAHLKRLQNVQMIGFKLLGPNSLQNRHDFSIPSV